MELAFGVKDGHGSVDGERRVALGMRTVIG